MSSSKFGNEEGVSELEEEALLKEVITEIEIEEANKNSPQAMQDTSGDWGSSPEEILCLEAESDLSNWPPKDFKAFIAKVRAHLDEMKEANRDKSRDSGHPMYAKRPKRPLKPKKTPLTDAERAKAYRDRKREAAIAAAPKIDKGKLEAEAEHRRELLEKRLAIRPLPPKLRHLLGRERELSMVWFARELIREPDHRCRQGKQTVSRVVDYFSELFPSVGELSTPSMNRRLNIVSFLEEEEIWPHPPKSDKGKAC